MKDIYVYIWFKISYLTLNDHAPQQNPSTTYEKLPFTLFIRESKNFPKQEIALFLGYLPYIE